MATTLPAHSGTLAYRARWRNFFLRAYMLRVPLLTLLALLFGFPYLFRTTMFHGLADVEEWQVKWVSLATFFLVSSAMTTGFIALLYGKLRADAMRGQSKHHIIPMWSVWLCYLLAAVCYVRFLAAIYGFSVESHIKAPFGLWAFVARAALGFVIAATLQFLVLLATLYLSAKAALELRLFVFPLFYLLIRFAWIKRRLQSLNEKELRWHKAMHKRTRRFRAWLARLVPWGGVGYLEFDSSGQPVDLLPGHLFAIFWVVFFLALYIWTGWRGYDALLNPERFVRIGSDTVIVYVLILLTALCWGLAGLTFFLDRYRFPVLVFLFLAAFLSSRLWRSDHTYDTIEITKTSHFWTPSEVMQRAPNRMIVVAAAGGGIQAAAWTSEILCGLRKAIGEKFDRSVVAISSVSGGSVGTLFYLGCSDADCGKTDMAEASQQSSLEAVAWGVVHPDLQRAIFPWHMFPWSERDRGWALEKSIVNHAKFGGKDRSLASLADLTQHPVLLLNSTVAETGQPFVFTNSQFPLSEDQCGSANGGIQNFHVVYPQSDVRLETAVRMSAAFPYVSPVARVDQANSAEHLADGGYFDNSGLYSLMVWLYQATSCKGTEMGSEVKGKQVLILVIDAFPRGTPAANRNKQRGWTYQWYAPLSTILHVRTEGQTVRDAIEVAGLKSLLGARGLKANVLEFSYDPPEPRQNVPEEAWESKCKADPPLSWHLTDVENGCVQKGWEKKKALVDLTKAYLNGEQELGLENKCCSPPHRERGHPTHKPHPLVQPRAD